MNGWRDRLGYLMARSFPVVHVLLNVGVVLVLLFPQQSMLYRTIYGGREEVNITEICVFFVLFALSLLFYLISVCMNPGYLTEKISRTYVNRIPSAGQPDLPTVEDHEEESDIGRYWDLEYGEDPTADDDFHSAQDLSIDEQSGSLVGGGAAEADQQSNGSEGVSSALLGRSPRSETALPEVSASPSVPQHSTSSGLYRSNRSLALTPKAPVPAPGKWSRLNDPGDLEFETQHSEVVASNKFAKFTNHMDVDTESTASGIKRSCFGRRNKKKQPLLPFPKRHCKTCGLSQPLRCHHCVDCNRCVMKFDHHCPWLANCIGERNHKVFIIFLFLQCLVVWWTFRYTLNSFIPSQQWDQWLKHNALFMANFIILIMGGIPASGLLFFHMYLACTGSTTWEIVSRSKISYLRDLPQDVNPFDKGCILNWLTFCCRPFPVPWDRIYTSITAKLNRKAARAQQKHDRGRGGGAGTKPSYVIKIAGTGAAAGHANTLADTESLPPRGVTTDTILRINRPQAVPSKPLSAYEPGFNVSAAVMQKSHA